MITDQEQKDSRLAHVEAKIDGLRQGHADILNALVAKPNKSDFANFATKDDLVHLEVRFDSIEIDVSDLKEILLNGRVNGDHAKARIQKVLDKVPVLHERGADSEEFRIWRRHTKTVLVAAFGSDSDHVKEFDNIDYVGWYPIVDSEDQNKRDATEAFQRGLACASAFLRELIREIDEYA